MRGRKLTVVEHNQRFKLYLKGLSDMEIAKELGVTRSAICSWRNYQGLSSNERQGGRKRRQNIEYENDQTKKLTAQDEEEVQRAFHRLCGSFTEKFA